MTEPSLSLVQRLFTRKLIFWGSLAALLVADLATKAWASANVQPAGERIIPVIDGVLAWKWAENEGAAFSIFHGNVGMLAVIASLVLGALLVYMFKAEPKRRFFLLALGLVASGAIGNLYDRLTRGSVRDFLFFDFDLPFWGKGIGLFGYSIEIPQRWPVFNVADIAIMAGVAILLVQSFAPQPKPAKKPEPATPAPADNAKPALEPEPATAGAEQP
jgi:signal peptidase II